MTFEELQINLNLVFDKEDKMKILDAVAKNCDEGYFFVDDNDGKCYLFDKDGNLDDIKKIKTLSEKYIKKNIKKIKLPTKVTSIGNYVFSDCKDLMSVMIPNSVTSIGNQAFYDCSSLMNITIPNNVMSIGYWAFEGCSGLTSMTIPDGVMNIENGLFYACRSLTSVMIPNSITNIGYYVFSGCSNLKELIFKGKTLGEVKTMENYPFGLEAESIIKVE